MNLRREPAKDGRDVRIYIEATYLGAVKQVPSLLDALLDVFPRAEYSTKLNDDDFTNDYTHNDNPSNDLTDVLRTDAAHILERMKRPMRTITGHARRPKRTKTKQCVRIHLSVDDLTYTEFPLIDCGNHFQLNIPVEPLKFEPRKLLSTKEQEEIRERYLMNNERVILGGSLRYGEMEAFYTAVKYAQKRDPRVRGIVVPREYDSNILEEHNRLMKKNPTHTNISFVSTKGTLQELYSICDTAVIGDTLWCSWPRSGQNPLEPAFYGKRIVSGNCHHSNNEAFTGLRESGLLTEVRDQNELNRELARTVTQEELAPAQERAYAFIKSQQGVARKVAQKIHEQLYT